MFAVGNIGHSTHPDVSSLLWSVSTKTGQRLSLFRVWESDHPTQSGASAMLALTRR